MTFFSITMQVELSVMDMGVSPCYEVIQGQSQDGEEQEHRNGPAVPGGVHVDL